VTAAAAFMRWKDGGNATFPFAFGNPVLEDTMRTRLRYTVVLAAALWLGLPVAVAQQPEDPAALRRELAEEKARIEEQVQQLKQQLTAYQEQEKRIEALEARLDAALAKEGATPGASAAAEAQATAASSQHVVPERLETAPNQTKDAHEVMTAAELVSDEFIGSWPLFGTDYRMKIGGYFKMDALYDLDGTGDKTQFLISQIPVEGSPEAGRSGYFNMFVRETRFNFDVRKSEPGGPPAQFFLEMDFFDESSFSPRLRHAYLVYGNLLVGQTWTTVTDLASLPFTIDFAAGDALFGGRTPQVRWQQQVGPNWSWAVGLEQLQTSGIYNPRGLGGGASPQLPVLGARVTHQRRTGVRTLAALVQSLHWDGEGVGPDATATGWALIFSGRQNFRQRDFFTWNLAWGDGTAENIMALTGSQANAVLTHGGHLITRHGYSAALGLGHRWSDTLSSNLAYAWTDLEDLGQRAPDAIISGGVGHLNLIWAPREKLSTGIEFMWGTRENADGADGDATRVQTMVKYLF